MKNVACNSTKQKLSTMIFGFTLLLMSFANVSFAKDITLTWEPSPETVVAGYKIYYGTSPGTYTGTEATNTGPSPVEFPGTETIATLEGLDDTKSHFFTVTAYNDNGEESAYANIVTAPPNTVDIDGDNFTVNQGDCDDKNPDINPGATDICGDSIDQDCSGSDEICPIDPNTTDDDGDGYSENQGDCNDTRSGSGIYPGATDICGDGIDQDCSGSDLICPIDPNTTDDDGDGYSENQGDCNDTRSGSGIYPGATDVCGDGIDQDCSNGDAVCPVDTLELTNPDKDGVEMSSSSAQEISWRVVDTTDPVDTVVIEYSRNDQNWKTLKTLSGPDAQATSTRVEFPTTRKSKEIMVKGTIKNAKGVVMGEKTRHIRLTR